MYKNWDLLIKSEQEKSYYKNLIEKINEEEQKTFVYPKKEDWFHAFLLTPIDNLKVVIIGQDPYHGPNQAHGLAFSTLDNTLPPSLINIYKELKSDLGYEISKKGDLTSWAKQGVLLLNTILTVSKSRALSHKDFGWQHFTLEVIELINKLDKPICFLLWGNDAKKYKKYLNNPKHLILESSHPSPLGAYRGFIGSKPFSKINNYLVENNVKPIDWALN